MYDIDLNDDPDVRAAAARARAQEILDRPPPEIDHAAQEERRRAERLAEIMARPSPSPETPIVRKVQENALIENQSSERRRLAVERDHNRMQELNANATVNGGITEAEYAEFWRIRRRKIYREAYDNVRANRVTAAIGLVMRELASISIVEWKARSDLRDRIEALEAAAKPRIRVRALSERSP